jgi:hypothetical protein
MELGRRAASGVASRKTGTTFILEVELPEVR